MIQYLPQLPTAAAIVLWRSPRAGPRCVPGDLRRSFFFFFFFFFLSSAFCRGPAASLLPARRPRWAVQRFFFFIVFWLARRATELQPADVQHPRPTRRSTAHRIHEVMPSNGCRATNRTSAALPSNS